MDNGGTGNFHRSVPDMAQPGIKRPLQVHPLSNALEVVRFWRRNLKNNMTVCIAAFFFRDRRLARTDTNQTDGGSLVLSPGPFERTPFSVDSSATFN